MIISSQIVLTLNTEETKKLFVSTESSRLGIDALNGLSIKAKAEVQLSRADIFKPSFKSALTF